MKIAEQQHAILGEDAGADWDTAISNWFYDHPTGFSDRVLSVLEDNAMHAYEELMLLGSWGPRNCTEASEVWKKIFAENGIRAKIVNGFFEPGHPPGQAFRGSSDHVWLEVEGGVFDPTAAQFSSNISLADYWLDEVTPAYDTPGSIVEKVDPDTAFEKYLDRHYGLGPSEIRKAKRDIEKYAEAPPDAPLGRVAFGPERRFPVYEPNTKTETSLIVSIETHFSGERMLDKQNADLIIRLMRKGLYPSILVPPAVPTIYRGMTVSKAWLAKTLGADVRDFKYKGALGLKGKADVNFKFVPKRGAASWSKSRAVATGFHDAGYDRANIILHADVSENEGRLLDASGMYKYIDILHRYRNEKEILGLGPIRVHMIEWEIEEY